MADTNTAEVRPKYDIRFPSDGRAVDQDQEWAEIGVNGTARRYRFHDYADLYEVPGLYEQIFYDELKCQSPQVVCGLLGEVLASEYLDPADLRIFDVGAGNGMVGEELAKLGAAEIVGVDIIEAAARATERDRPGVYDSYHVLDLTDIPAAARSELEDRQFNCLVTVAALGFGDIPPRAFAEAYNLTLDDGWVAFNIKEAFLAEGESSGFSRLIEHMTGEGAMEMKAGMTYRHRLSTAGEPLDYRIMIARKQRDIPQSWIE
ncbi:MAG: methyltransferase domain-containing protein [Actinomycetota bacterium]|nr:methyltransferase domain-containing protein [Actinomycetota bacterium]